MRTVAALYIDPLGPYPRMPGVDAWDEARNADLYGGPHPVVAHPPCSPWSKMRWLSTPEYRSKYRYCAINAVAAVRVFGGVLEHPQRSALWEALNIRLPGMGEDQYGGRSYFVSQVAWGHQCTKPTWLYVVGVSDEIVRSGIKTGGTPTHVIMSRSGSQLRSASKVIRSRTPIDFARWLIYLARMSRSPMAEAFK